MRRGWFNQSWRHSLAAKGIITSPRRSFAKGFRSDLKVWDPAKGREVSILHKMAAEGKPIADLVPHTPKEDINQFYPRDLLRNYAMAKSQETPDFAPAQLSITTGEPYADFAPTQVLKDPTYSPEVNLSDELMDKQQARPVDGLPPLPEEPPRPTTLDKLSELSLNVTPVSSDLTTEEEQLATKGQGVTAEPVGDLLQ